MKKYFASLFAFFLLASFASCTSTEKTKTAATNPVIASTKTLGDCVTLIRSNKSVGGSHQDTLVVRYSAKDRTHAPIALMFVSNTTGGSHPETTFVEKVVLRPYKK